MRKIITVLSSLMLVSMLLAACAGEETSTVVPSTPGTSDTQEPTLELTPMTEEPGMTETLAPTEEGTPGAGIPVTGEEDPSRLSNELNYDVWNGDGDQIGEVNDMVVDLGNSRVSYVIVGTGGFLEIGEKDVLVPWDQLQLQTASDTSGSTTGDTNAFVLLADQQMFENAPDVDVDTLLPPQGQANDNWDLDLRNYWQSGVVPGTPSAGETAMPEMTPTIHPEMTAMPGANGNMPSALQGVVLASDLLGSDITVGASGTVMQDNTAVGTAAAGTPEATPLSMATATLSTGLNTPSETQTATVDDVIVDTDTGEIRFLVLDASFTDGERWVPVPLSQFQWDAVNGSYLLNTDQATFEAAPSFPDGQYPDTTVSGWDTEFLNYWP